MNFNFNKIKSISKDEVMEYIPEVVMGIILITVIIFIIYGIKNTSYEVSYTSGTVVEKYEEHYTTKQPVVDSDGDISFRTIHHDDYIIIAKVKDTNLTAALNHRTFYEHHNVGDTVKIKKQDRYWKGEYQGTSYFIVY